MIDFACKSMRKLFMADEWSEIELRNKFELPALPDTTVEYLLQVRQAMIGHHPMVKVLIPEQDRGSCELIMQTFQVW